jgi:hypothetical protein
MNKEYPKLMKSKSSGCVVKFTAACVGTVVVKGNRKSYHVGYSTKSWVMERFVDYSVKKRKLNTNI